MTDDLEPRLAEALHARADVDSAGVESVLVFVSWLPHRQAPGRRTSRLVAAAAAIVGIAVLGVSIGLSGRFAATPSLTPGLTTAPTATASTSPSVLSPVTAIDQDAMFRLSLIVTRSSQASGTPIDVLGSLTYLGPKAAITARSGDRLVYFHAQRDGDPQIGGPWLDPCFEFPMTRDQPVEYRLTAAVPGFENLADSSLRLPQGIWHIRASASPSLTPCGPDTHSLAAEVTIEVLGPQGIPMPSPSATPVRSDPGPS